MKNATVAEPVATYFDTSALAKRYVAERGSHDVDAFLAGQDDAFVISPLVATELESVLRRLLRQRLIDAAFAAQARIDFAADLTAALWAMHPFEAASFARASVLIRELDSPLATVDALHLACAIEFGCDAIATGDRQLARAAQASGLIVHSFVT